MPENVSDQQKAIFRAALKVNARVRRVEFARSTILYCILAAEAYANQYLQWHLTGAPSSRAPMCCRRCRSTCSALVLWSGTICSSERGPDPTLGKLLGLRSRLVHPKLRPKAPLLRASEDPPDFEIFNPDDGARYFVTVAEAVVTMFVAGRTPPYFDPVVGVIASDRGFFLQFGEAASRELTPFGTEPAPDLMLESIRRRERRT